MSLSPDQARALARIEEFIRAPRFSLARPYFSLMGLAGTGKTYLIAQLARMYAGQMMMCAPTGKAASVLRKRVGMKVSTIHSAIYNFCGTQPDERGEHQPIFVSKDLELPDHVILCDESSMVGRTLAEELLRTGARLITSGDPGQLPPVRDTMFFGDADATLTQVHRQALESPIIRQAHRIRHESDYGPDGDNFRVVSRAEPEDILGHDVILCWRNRTRIKLNARKRELLGKSGKLKAGEPVMCLRNCYELGIYNGEVYSLARNYDPEEQAVVIVKDDGMLAVEPATVEGDSDFDRLRNEDDCIAFAPAYAVTVHKSQGSEFPSVLLFDEAERDRSSFLYTGVTRASERVTVVRWRT